MSRPIQEPTVNEDAMRDGKKYSHPAFGQIVASRHKVEHAATDIFVTKYALSAGIGVYTLDHFWGEEQRAVVVHRLGGMNQSEMFHKPDWHMTLSEARAQALGMQMKKIVSLQKQIKKLDALDFLDTSYRLQDLRWDGKRL
jgi:hypothetical protein